MQAARNPTDDYDGFLKRTRYLIHDRDSLFTERLREVLNRVYVQDHSAGKMNFRMCMAVAIRRRA